MIRECNVKVKNERAGEIKTKLFKNKLIINVWDILQHYRRWELDSGIPIELELNCE